MTKLNEKLLSQLLEEIEVESADRMSLRNDLAKLKRVAIELAKACETTAIMDNDCGRWCKRSLSRAKDIIGEVK